MHTEYMQHRYQHPHQHNNSGGFYVPPPHDGDQAFWGFETMLTVMAGVWKTTGIHAVVLSGRSPQPHMKGGQLLWTTFI